MTEKAEDNLVTKRGLEFANEWVSENVNVGPYLDVDDSQVSIAVEQMLIIAVEKGISRAEVEEEVGNLSDFIADSFESATDDEVSRLANKDD